MRLVMEVLGLEEGFIWVILLFGVGVREELFLERLLRIRALAHIPLRSCLKLLVLDRRSFYFEARCELSFHFEALMQQIVHRCHLVMLVTIQTGCRVVSFETEFFEMA